MLELTHIIAGPTAGRVLAEQGAEVLHVAPPGHLDQTGLVIELGVGKRSVHLDLREFRDREALSGLIAGTDIFISSYRPGALATFGLSETQLQRMRPGIVIVSIDGLGRGGPWAGRRGVDPIAQAVPGIAHEHLAQGSPSLVRGGPLTDPLAGYLAAAGAVAALNRRAAVGGSHRVAVTLSRIAMWVAGLGAQRVTLEGKLDSTYRRFAHPWLVSMGSPFGTVTYLAPLAQFDQTPGHWASPPVPRGASARAWLP